MRTCRRNKTLIYYSLANVDTFDEWGNKAKGYSEPKSAYFVLSVDTGNADYTPFGQDLDFDRFMASTDINCPIDEYSHIWIGKTPKEGKHNYIVKRKAITRRQVRYALKKVTNENEI